MRNISRLIDNYAFRTCAELQGNISLYLFEEMAIVIVQFFKLDESVYVFFIDFKKVLKFEFIFFASAGVVHLVFKIKVFDLDLDNFQLNLFFIENIIEKGINLFILVIRLLIQIWRVFIWL